MALISAVPVTVLSKAAALLPKTDRIRDFLRANAANHPNRHFQLFPPYNRELTS